jgi:hypothetical protein
MFETMESLTGFVIAGDLSAEARRAKAEAKQSRASRAILDCFGALRLAMTSSAC